MKQRDRGQAEAKTSRPRPKPKLRGRSRGQNFGLEATLASRTYITGYESIWTEQNRRFNERTCSL